jgi:hypothetical protein
LPTAASKSCVQATVLWPLESLLPPEGAAENRRPPSPRPLLFSSFSVSRFAAVTGTRFASLRRKSGAVQREKTHSALGLLESDGMTRA